MDKKRLFVDMDGTLARFHDQVNYLERMFEKNFFRELEPFENMVEGVRQFIQDHPDVEVFVLSARVIGEPPYCEAEKNAWMDRYLPEIDQAHRIYTDMGRSKAEYIPGGVTKNDYLLDDYNKGLNLWLYDGGSAIKCHNNINQRGLGAYGGSAGMLWTGDMVHTDDSPEMIAAELSSHMGFEYDLEKVLSANEDIAFSEFTPGQRLNPNPYTPGTTLYLSKVHEDKYNSERYEATFTSEDFTGRTAEQFTNPLNAIRWLESKPGYIEHQLQCSDGTQITLPHFQADALSFNLYGCSVPELLSSDEDRMEIADAFRLAIEKSAFPMVGQVHYLGFNGEVGETAIFRTVKEMKDEIEDCQDCGCPIMVDWFINPKRYQEVTLYCSPDLGAPEVFTLSADNLRKAAEICGFSIGSIDDFLSEYTWDESADIWREYGQYVDMVANVMVGFASRKEVEEEFYNNMSADLDFPVETAIFMLKNIENWVRGNNDEAFRASVMDKATTLLAQLEGSEPQGKPSLDSMIFNANGRQDDSNKKRKDNSPDR